MRAPLPVGRAVDAAQAPDAAEIHERILELKQAATRLN